MTLSATEEHALSSEEEWELLADFGFYVSEEGSDAVPEFPIPLMSCRILDADGNTVRVLADQEMAEIVQPARESISAVLISGGTAVMKRAIK